MEPSLVRSTAFSARSAFAQSERLKSDRILRSLFLLNLVELSGYCPPSPKSLTGAFSRLSFEFYLFRRTPQSGAYRRPQILYLVRASNHAIVPARVFGRIAERLGPTLCVRSLL